MDKLEKILVALERNGDAPGDIDRARELSTQYVKDNPDEFADYAAFGLDAEGLVCTVRAVELFRAAGMRQQWARAEAWHFANWEPQNIGGATQPVLRNLNQ